jgi:hypothetical protein
MATGPFPSDPSSRKAILVLQKYDIEKCKFEPGAAQTLLDDEAYVLELPVSTHREGPTALQNLIEAGLARPGAILVQSPYDTDTYEYLEHAARRFALAKHMYFSRLCQDLGAKEVIVEQSDLSIRREGTSSGIKAKRLGESAQAALETDELRKFRAEIHLRDEFTGGSPDLESAERMLRRTGLWADPNLRALLDMRRGSNPLTARTLVLNLSSEAKNSLKIVGRLKLPTFLTLSVEYDRLVQEQHDYTMRAVVRF